MSIATPERVLAVTARPDEWEAVLTTAAALAGRCGAELHVLHVTDAPQWSGGGAGERRAEAERSLRTILERLPDDAARMATIHLSDGDLRRQVLSRVRDVDADLVVSAFHHGAAITAHVFGTTAEAVARDAHRPCLVVRDALHLPARQVGVPTDLSDASADALRLVLQWRTWLIGDPRDEGRAAPPIRYVHVGWPVERADNPEMEAERVRPAMQRQVDAAVHDAQAAGGDGVGIEVLWSHDPVDAIVRWVRTESVELLVVGTHGWHGPRRVLLGSDAVRLARELPCAVLIVPPSPHGAATDEDGSGRARSELDDALRQTLGPPSPVNGEPPFRE